MNFEISAVGVNQAALLAQCHAACFDNAWTAESFIEILTMPHTFAWAYHCPHRNLLSGFVLVQNLGLEAEILSLAVAPQSRRHGQGHELMRRAIGWAEAMGCQSLVLEVAEHNDPAHELYRGLGFNRISIRKNYYTKQNENAIILRLSL